MKKLFAVILIFYISWIFADPQTNPKEGNCTVNSVTGPAIVCIGKTAKFTVATIPEKCPVIWTGGGTPKGQESKASIFETKWDTAGKKTIKVKCKISTSFKEIEVEVVEIDSLTVTDANDATVTATNPTKTELVIWDKPSEVTKIKIEVSGDISTPAVGALVLWSVEGNNATPSSGNFGGEDPVVTLTPTGTPENRTFPVNVGCDEDKDGVLDQAEILYTIKVFTPKAVLKSVEFKDDNIVSADNGIEYKDADWEDKDLNGIAEKKQPVAYVRKETMSVSTQWDLGVAITDISKVKVRAVWEHPTDSSQNQKLAYPDGTSTGLSVQGKILTLAKTAFDTPLANYVGLFDKLGLKWEVSCNDGTSWIDAGKSENVVYCTWAEPVKTDNLLFHTALHIGCYNANGITGTNAVMVFNKIWEEFSDRKVSRLNPAPCKMPPPPDPDPNGMIYWKEGLPPGQIPNCATVSGMLRAGHTSCGTWSLFLRACANAQGIAGHTLITINAPQPDFNKLKASFKAANSITGTVYLGFNNGSSITYPVQPVPNMNNRVLELFTNNRVNYGIFFVKMVAFGGADFIKIPLGDAGFPKPSSSPGQGNSNARAWFGNHAIVKYNNDYYDPSYGGIIHDTPIKWENVSLQNYGAGFNVYFFNINGTKVYQGSRLWSERDDPKGSQETTFN